MTKSTGSVGTAPLGAPSSDLDPFSDEFLTDPYSGHTELREAGPVVWLTRYRIWAMARYADVHRALRDADTCCSSAGVGLPDLRKEKPWRQPSLLIEADPPEHTRARAVVNRVLAPPAVRRLKDGFQRTADELVAGLVARGSFDAVRELAEPAAMALFSDAMGLPQEGRENLLPYGAMAFNVLGPRNDHFHRAMRGVEPARRWIDAHCEPGALEPGGLGAPLHEIAQEAGYSGAEAALLLRSLLSAGVDTTVYTLGNAVACLAEHPEQFAALRGDLSLARGAFEEVLRYTSPVQTFFRTTNRAVRVDGLDGSVEIPEGEKVVLFLGAANRGPRRWERPDEFDITRRTVGHVDFGAGPHACVGMMMARLEGEVVLTALAKQVAELWLVGPTKPRLNHTLHGLDELPVRVVPA